MFLIMLAALLSQSVFAATAFAAGPYAILNNSTGGQCTQIGTWDNGAKTCTLTTDLSESAGIDTLVIGSDGITVDGAGHTITGYGNFGNGVLLVGRNSVVIKNLRITGYNTGIQLSNSGATSTNTISGNTIYGPGIYGMYLGMSNNSDIHGNTISGMSQVGIAQSSSVGNNVYCNYTASNGLGMTLDGSTSNSIHGNTISSSSNTGLYLTSGSNNNTIYTNNFLGNTYSAYDDSTGNSFSLTFFTAHWGNHWSDFDTPAEGCVDISPFDALCDNPYNVGGPATSTDAYAYILPSGWNSYHFTWYDNIGGRNWVLLANPSGNTVDVWADLSIDGAGRALPALPGYAAGQIPPGRSITPIYPGLRGGPVLADSRDLFTLPVVSQRILWPVGGNSLEEVPGIWGYDLSNRFWWTWYDMKSPGYKNWVLISNPNAFDVRAEVWIGATKVWDSVVTAGGRQTPQFPGWMGGPVKVEAYVSGTVNPANVMASQRILMNGDTAFNELPGIPEQGYLATWDHVWTWYDMTGGAKNWILIANPTSSANPIYYRILIAGNEVGHGGPIAAGSNDTPTYAGTIGGPVEVQTYFDSNYIWPAPSICSQRSLWGGSFEEVPGADATTLTSSYNWTWYDQLSAGATNWVLVANPSSTETITATISFTDQNGALQTASQDIAPNGRWTPTFPGKMGGPVNVKAVKQGTTTAQNVITSQRVLWNGFFNEVWGQ